MSKAAIVTGASSGIGLAISRVLCEKGYDIQDWCPYERGAGTHYLIICV